MDQRYDEATRDYLARFMDLTSQIFNLDSRQATNLFVRGVAEGIASARKIIGMSTI